MKKRSNYQGMPKTLKFAKSSPEARRLIRTTKRGHSWRQVASILKLPNAAQAYKMMVGSIQDTPSMKAAIKRADVRARRAWLMTKDDHQEIDCKQVLDDIRDVRRKIEIIEANVKAYSEKTHKDSMP